MRLAVRESWFAFRRAPLLGILSITTIAFSLFAFGLFGLVAVNLQTALRDVENRVEIRVFLADGTSEDDIATMLGDASAFPEVAEAGFVSPDSGLARARQELPEFQDVLDVAVLPASIEVRLKEGFRDPDHVREVAQRLNSYPTVDEIRYGEEWVAKLYKIRTVAAVAGAGLGAVFALVSIIIIGSTIRMAVLARAREIEIMRLVGATNWFVRAPYLLDGLVKGLLGGAIALGLTLFASNVISKNLVQTAFFETWQISAGLAAGALIGFLGSAVSVGRHLKQVWREEG
jgi:cell division transport system permease protein